MLWVSAHVFYNYDQMDDLIVEAIAPCVREIEEAGFLRQFFFIRFGERGPHLRLRLNVDASHVERVHGIVTQHIEAYLAQHPSAPVPANVVQIVSREELTHLPNNSLHFIPYMPETVRYGGAAGVRVAERHFENSSRLVCSLLARSYRRPDRQDVAFLYALQLAAALVTVAGFTGEQAALFYRDHLSHIKTPIDEAAVDLFYEINQPSLLAKYTQIGALCRNSAATSDEQMVSWIANAALRCEELRLALASQGNKYSEMNPMLGVNRKFALIIQSYIHMTMNRLGVWVPRERFALEVLYRLAVDFSSGNRVPL